MVAAVPAGQTCTGTMAGASNVCLMRCMNAARKSSSLLSHHLFPLPQEHPTNNPFQAPDLSEDVFQSKWPQLVEMPPEEA